MMILNVRTVPDSYDKVDPSRIKGCYILDDVPEEFPVGHHDLHIVGCGEHCGKQANFLHSTGLARAHDEIPYFERAKYKNEDASGKIGQRPLQRETDGKARRTKDGDEGCRLYAEFCQSSEHREG